MNRIRKIIPVCTPVPRKDHVGSVSGSAIAVPPFVPDLYTDNFNRANSNVLGAPWVQRQNAAGAIKIASNTLTFQPVDNFFSGSSAEYDVVFNSANQYVQILYVSCQDTKQGFHLTLRSQGALGTGNGFDNTGCYRAIIGANVTIIRRVGAVQTVVANLVQSEIASVGSVFRFEANGTLLTVKKDGSTLLTGTDAVITAMGRTGVISLQGNGLACVFDDFETGTLAP